MNEEILKLLKEVNSEIKEIKIQVEENKKLLKKLESLEEVNKAKIVETIDDLKDIEGVIKENCYDIVKLRSYIKRL